tara:strand:- start:1404 stop:1517 length:114 start_codon:yes stop_codon:yes gene_type:complete
MGGVDVEISKKTSCSGTLRKMDFDGQDIRYEKSKVNH